MTVPKIQNAASHPQAIATRTWIKIMIYAGVSGPAAILLAAFGDHISPVGRVLLALAGIAYIGYGCLTYKRARA